jgi:hypothetical protein
MGECYLPIIADYRSTVHSTLGVTECGYSGFSEYSGCSVSTPTECGFSESTNDWMWIQWIHKRLNVDTLLLVDTVNSVIEWIKNLRNSRKAPAVKRTSAEAEMTAPVSRSLDVIASQCHCHSWFLILDSWFLILDSWFLILDSWFLTKTYKIKTLSFLILDHNF